MSRKSIDELNKIKEKYKIDKLWSWSRVNLVHTSRYEYFLKYIKHEKELNEPSVYLSLGGVSHNILEDLYTGQCEHSDMINTFDNYWTTTIDVMGLKFDRTNSDMNEKIKCKYYNNLKLFFENHMHIKYKTAIEQFVTIKIDNKKYLQGYIDCMFKDEFKNVHIIDFKTSTIYKGDKLQNECGQLVLYALALNQLKIPVDKIKIGWNFLKYNSVTVSMKNKSTKIRNIERSKLGESLKANATMWLKHFGYQDKLEEYIKDLIIKNDISCLPKEVREKFIIDDCYVYVDLDSNLINKWKQYVKETINEIETLEKKYNKTKDERLFWDDDENIKNQTYYFNNLCGYSISQMLPYKEFLDKNEEIKKQNDNLLYSPKEVDVTSIDLSWLDNA